MTCSVHFSVALDALKEIIAVDYPRLLEHPECDAILSHWLHAPDIRPPLLPDELYEARKRIFMALEAALQ